MKSGPVESLGLGVAEGLGIGKEQFSGCLLLSLGTGPDGRLASSHHFSVPPKRTRQRFLEGRGHVCFDCQPLQHTGKGRKGFYTKAGGSSVLGCEATIVPAYFPSQFSNCGFCADGMDALTYCPWVDFGEQL